MTAQKRQISWHVPNAEEVDFALELFREIVEPALAALKSLLENGKLISI